MWKGKRIKYSRVVFRLGGLACGNGLCNYMCSLSMTRFRLTPVLGSKKNPAGRNE